MFLAASLRWLLLAAAVVGQSGLDSHLLLTHFSHGGQSLSAVQRKNLVTELGHCLASMISLTAEPTFQINIYFQTFGADRLSMETSHMFHMLQLHTIV